MIEAKCLSRFYHGCEAAVLARRNNFSRVKLDRGAAVAALDFLGNRVDQAYTFKFSRLRISRATTTPDAEA